MAGKKIKGVSFGTMLALILTAIILAGSVYVLLRLSSGHEVDLSRLNGQVEGTNAFTGMDANASKVEIAPEEKETAAPKGEGTTAESGTSTLKVESVPAEKGTNASDGKTTGQE